MPPMPPPPPPRKAGGAGGRRGAHPPGRGEEGGEGAPHHRRRRRLGDQQQEEEEEEEGRTGPPGPHLCLRAVGCGPLGCCRVPRGGDGGISCVVPIVLERLGGGIYRHLMCIGRDCACAHKKYPGSFGTPPPHPARHGLPTPVVKRRQLVTRCLPSAVSCCELCFQCACSLTPAVWGGVNPSRCYPSTVGLP